MGFGLLCDQTLGQSCKKLKEKENWATVIAKAGHISTDRPTREGPISHHKRLNFHVRKQPRNFSLLFRLIYILFI